MIAVSHTNPRHLDDTIASIILSNKLKINNIKLIHPQNVDRNLLIDKNCILIDVGMDYNPELNNYDHHHDLNIECSLNLIIKNFFPEINPECEFIKQIDIIDRFGFNKSNLKPNDKIDEMRKIILSSDLFNRIESIGKIVYNEVKNGSDNNYNLYEFIENLYYNLDKIGAIEDGKLIVENERRQIEEAINNLQIKNVEGKVIAISKINVSKNIRLILDKYPEIEILIERNSMNPDHTSIIVNSNKENYDEIVNYANDIARRNGNIIFEHKNRFIRVIDNNIENVKI